MAKSLKKSLAMLIVALMTVGMFAPQALAAETTTTTDTQTTTEGGITTTLTTTTETTVDGNTTTVVVTINTAKTGTDETGAEVNYNETTTETTVTTNEPDGSVTETESFEEDGSETLEWDEIPEEEDLPENVVLPEYEVPEVEVELIPGETTTGSASVTETETTDDESGSTETTVTIDREVTVETSEIETSTDTSDLELDSIAPSPEEGEDSLRLHGDTASSINPEYWPIDFGFYSPDSESIPDGWTVERVDDDTALFVYTAEDGAKSEWTIDWTYGSPAVISVITEGNIDDSFDGKLLYTGYGHFSNTKIRVEYLYDENTKLYAARLFALRDQNNEYEYAYCVDCPTASFPFIWYTVDNLEDNTYYATEDAENHIRYIATNGYWGTAPGDEETAALGSLQYIKDNMLADPNIDLDEVVTVGGKDITVRELINGIDESEALNATQAAIWTYSNGSYAADNNEGTIVTGNFSNTAKGVSSNDRLISQARMELLYNYLIQGTLDASSTPVIDSDNFIDDMSITIGEKVDEVESINGSGETVVNGVYDTALNFTLAFIPGENDDLLMQLKYTDLDGNEQIIVKRLAGTNDEGESFETITPAEDGSYTISGLKLSENEDFNFDLRLEGTQHLEKGVYIYEAVGGRYESQTMVGIAEGTQDVSVSASMTVSFSVDEEEHVVAQRTWHNEEDPETTVTPPPPPINDPPEEEEELPPPPPDMLNPPPEEIIPDEEVPLAEVPYTGDDSAMWLLVIGPAGLGLIALNLSDKKRKEENI